MATKEITKDLVKKVSIFDTYDRKQKTSILLASAFFALLTPFTDTIYLPALTNVGETLHASDTDVALTVSMYMAAAAVGQICWGCFSDYHGRLPSLYIGVALYLIVTVACIFPSNVQTLIVLRTLEGFLIGSTIVTVTAIIADVYEPAERGTAMGAFLTPLLVGPVIAPVIGGALSEAYSWRATFVLLAVLTIPLVALAIYVLPETHHYFVVQRVASNNAKYISVAIDNVMDGALSDISIVEVLRAAATNSYADCETGGLPALEMVDSGNAPTSALDEGIVTPPSDNVDIEKGITVTEATMSHPDVIHLLEAEGMVRDRMVMPWESLTYLVDPQLAPSFILMCILFSTVFATLISLPLYLSRAPYNLNTTIIGILFLPSGISMLIGSIVGGIVSDYSQARYPKTPEGRLVYSIPFLVVVPIGAVAFGFSLAYGTSLGYVLVSQSVLVFGEASMFPTLMGYVTTCRPKNASAVTSVLTFVSFGGSAIVVTIAPAICASIGLEWFYVIFGSLCLVAIVWSVSDFTKKAL